jgi:predicted nucleic acid-binding protein
MGPEVTKYLLDSNIIIYHLNGEKTATRFILENKDKCAVSQITYLEVLSFEFTNEQFPVVKEFMDSFRAIDIDRKLLFRPLKTGM